MVPPLGFGYGERRHALLLPLSKPLARFSFFPAEEYYSNAGDNNSDLQKRPDKRVHLSKKTVYCQRK